MLVGNSSLIKESLVCFVDVFLRKLVAKPYAGNFALAPHVYGQGVTQLYGDFGPKLFARLTASWGAKAKNGYAGKPIPVIIGEIGSILVSHKHEIKCA